MAYGKKTGGRQKGTPNKDTKALQDRIAERYPGWDPVEAMAEIAQDDKNDVMIRLAALKEIAQYIHPKRKAIEHTGKDGKDLGPMVITREIVERKV